MNKTEFAPAFNKETLNAKREFLTKPDKLIKEPSNKYNSYNSECKSEDISGYPTPSFNSGF
jgi:hypothetical protein